MARGRAVRGRTQRRKMQWLFLDFGITQHSAASAILIASLNAAALALRPFTIVRSHIALFQMSDQGIASEVQSLAFGLTIVSDQAVAAGVASVPAPAANQESDWLLHQWMLSNATDFTDSTVPGIQFQSDSKAMRKVDVGSDLVVVSESVTASGVRLSSAGRILIKLH